MRGKWVRIILWGAVIGVLFGCGAAQTTASGVNAPAVVGATSNKAIDLTGDAAARKSSAVAQTQGGSDLSLDRVLVTQAVYDEPLIFNKDTVVRAVVGYTGAGTVDARVTVEFDGKTFTETKPVQGKQTVIDVFVGAPQNFQTQTVTARVEAAGESSGDDPANNSKSVTLEMVKPNETITAYFLPVDWTTEQRQRYNFAVSFPKFVQDNAIYLRGAYPLSKDQITVDFSSVPHMLSANEKHLANNQGDTDVVSQYLLYATISLAARRLKPDATLVVGVLPPGWFAAHGKRGALGMALRDVKGTVTGQYAVTDPTTSAHELAHLYWLYEDYDYSIDPPRPFTWLDRSGYFVEAKLPEEISPDKKIPTFLSSGAPDQAYWVDTRAYEYLTAKFTIQPGGQVTAPMILAATMARQIDPDKNYPTEYSAGWQRYEPKQTVYVSVGAADLRGGETLEARWFNGDQQVFKDAKTTQAGSAWYAFSLRNSNGMPEGNYHVDIYLDGKLVKTSKFEVKSSQ
ncbi:MAG: hypothetical protein HY741_21525 [Chloroflexi bacterium]|nr:hypothetical protein [Chloroflexota bacterium]